MTTRIIGPTRTRDVTGTLHLDLSSGRLRLIAHMDLETYLPGVLNGEVSADWPLEALKAQAVAARTYALYQIRHRRGSAFDVYGDTRSQEYKGAPRYSAALSLSALECSRGGNHGISTTHTQLWLCGICSRRHCRYRGHTKG